MMYGLFITLFVMLCFLLMLMIIIQKSKGSLGLGNVGGGMQMLFGGSGGQTLFQKVTWILGALFMASSLGLALYKSKLPAKYLDLSSSRVLDFKKPASQASEASPKPTNEPTQQA